MVLKSAPAAITPSPEDVLAAFAGIPVAVISDALDALGLPNTVMNHFVRRMVGKHLVGYARTISKIRVPANATQDDLVPSLGMGTQELLDSSRAGEVIVIASSDSMDGALWGDNMGTRAQALGVRGVITDGAVRDIDEMEKLGLAIFARATTPRQASKRLLTLTIDEPVICGGILVRSHDVIVGDADGVVVVPAQEAKAIATRAKEIAAIEGRMHDYLREGNTLVSAVLTFKQR